MGVLEHTNRIDYGRILMPDEGWQTSWAIGTTYSLDLEVLMSVPLALFHGKYLSETTDLRNLRTDMLDALDKVKDRLFVFVHENNISAKCAYSMLMAFLDQNIWNIQLDSPNKNFHPKVWLVRYENISAPEQYKYRFIVMSRNMTAATDFDIAVSMDSYQTEKEHEDNASLVRMMTALMNHTKRNKIIKQFSKELKNIRFSAPYPFDSKPIMFWPHTFKGDKSPLLRNDKYNELLVISPFIDNDTLDLLSSKVTEGAEKKPILVSREYEMDALNPETLHKWDCYQWNSMLEEAADYEEYENDKINEETFGRSISLHAKIFIAKAALGRDSNQWNNWFVGSTNSTQAGLRVNYEAQVQLRSNREETSPQKVLKSLLNPDAPLISRYTIKTSSSTNEEKELEKKFRNVIYDISHLPWKGEYIIDTQDKYVTHIVVDKSKWDTFIAIHQDAKIILSPFYNKNEKWFLKDSNEYSFSPSYCQQLSTFIRVCVSKNDTDKEFLMHLPLLIPEERHGKIMSEILDNEEKIMSYLMFCLDSKLDIEMQKIGSELKFSRQSTEESSTQPYSLPIYERLMLAASRDRAALSNIKENVERLKNVKGKDGKRLLSKEFLEMWNKFSVYAK